jgi:hypothetical protein
MTSDRDESDAPAPLPYARPGAFWKEPTWWTVLLFCACLLGIFIICAILRDWLRG